MNHSETPSSAGRAKKKK